MNNVPGMTTAEAYDITRKEFYYLRQEEEIEQRVAKEEARMVGSYFGQSFLQVGMHLENLEHERWKKWAGREIERIHGEQMDAYGTSGDDPLADPENADLDQLTETIENMAIP